MNYTKPVLNGEAASMVIRGNAKLTDNPDLGGKTDPAYEADE